MTLAKIKENVSLASLFLLLLVPFIGPYRYYNATGFINDMSTVSCITLVLLCTLIYCKKIVIPKYIILLLCGGILLVATTFFNSTYEQARLSLIIWLISAALISICISSIKNQYANDGLFYSKLASYMFYSAFLIAVIAFLAFYFVDPFAKLTHIAFYYNGPLRMDSFLGQPNLLAIILFLGIVAYYYISSEIKNKYRLSIYLLMVFLISFCLFSTLSRVALVALVVFVFYVSLDAFRHNNKRGVLRLLVIIGLAYFSYQALHPLLIEYGVQQQWIPAAVNDANQIDSVSYNRATNLDHKLDEIRRALTIFSQHPITGVGFGRYGYYSQQLTLAGWPVYIVGFPYHSHNIISQILAEFGAIGAGVLLVSIILTVRVLIKSYSSRAHLFLFGLVLIFGINALFEYALWNLNFAVLLFALFAGFSNDKVVEVELLKTLSLKVAYGVFMGVFILVLASRWSIIDTLNTIFLKPENVIYAQSMTEDRLMGLDFSSIYLAGIKFSDATDKQYENEVTKVEKWRPTDMVYYRKVQLDIGNNNAKDITTNIKKALRLGANVETFDKLFQIDCQIKNEACRVAESYLISLKK